MAGELFQPLICELENIWKETDELKHYLDHICDTSWSVLKPPGSETHGTFKIEKKNVEDDQLKEHSSSSAPVDENLLRELNELLSYGKRVLDQSQISARQKYTNKPKCLSENTSTNKTKITSVQSQNSQPTQSQTNLSSSRLRSHQSNSSQTNKTASQGDELRKEVKSVQKPDETVYVHKCSLTLSDTLKTLRMPKDLRHVLKQYYHYQEKKSKPASLEHLKITHNFQDRMCKLAKARLEYSMSANPKLPDRYKKYVEIADQESNISQTPPFGGSTAHSKQQRKETIVNTLLLREEKWQLLMELQLQQQVLDDLLTSLE